MPTLDLTHVTKRFKGVTALNDISLRVDEGEMMCLLGPSGCGKTTMLRIIAGFEELDAGDVRLAGADITRVPAQKRDIGLVFQSYALFPHMSVNENVGFGLKMRNRPRDEIEKAVREALRLVRLDNVGERLPKQLSGGQQQRVALARAIAIRPQLLLLDEPLSNLDAKLRDEMREEIRRVQKTVGITAVFVTHDQSEALAMADRMAIMDHGLVMQVDTPVNVYERPANAFVASFIGQANLLRGRVVEVRGDMARVETASGISAVGMAGNFTVGSSAVAVVKNERIALAETRPLDTPNAIAARIETRTYLGATIQYLCAAAGEKFGAIQPNLSGGAGYEPGSSVVLSWQPNDCLILQDPLQAA